MPADLPGVVTTLDAGLLRVTTLDPPARMNAVRIETLDAVTDAFEWCAGDSAVRAAVLTGAGGAFCTGADQSTTTTNDRPTAATIDAATIDAANRTVAVIRAFPRPVVGAVNGPAAGVGVSLALACDLTVATKSSYFLLAFTKVGLMPDGGATALVAASIGRARAMKMTLVAERLPALDNAFARERNGQLELLATPDFEEGVTAFLNRRPAEFRRS
ncbi:enoyl-CoA hydratase [Rhodococcus sp. SC4]|nr:enoyl-CoA hydratase [Rhodococcus sp. SC4]